MRIVRIEWFILWVIIEEVCEGVAVVRKSQRGYRHRRVQNDNKNNDKNNKNTEPPSMYPTYAPSKEPTVLPTTHSPSESPAPSPSPSSTPTLSQKPSTRTPSVTPFSFMPTHAPSTSPPSTFPTTPSVSPTHYPTSSPSDSPSTSFPSQSPSAAPSVSGIIGFLFLKISVIANSNDIHTASDLIQNELLRQTLEDIQTQVFCQDTDFFVIGQNNTSICGQFTSSQGIIHKYQRVRVSVDEIVTSDFNYTSWTFRYPVLFVGERYKAMAEANIRANATAQTSDTTRDEGVIAMESVAQLALDLRLESGQFTIPQGRVAITGNELEVWTKMNRSSGVPLPPPSYLKPIHPGVLHPLRLAGIIMLITNFAFWFWLLFVSQNRRKEREWEQAVQKRAKGGLVTEDGLDFMLEAGLNSTSMPLSGHLSEGDEEETRLPLPGAYQTSAMRIA